MVAMQLLVPMRLPSTLRACCPGTPHSGFLIPIPAMPRYWCATALAACNAYTLPAQCNAMHLGCIPMLAPLNVITGSGPPTSTLCAGQSMAW